MTRARDIAWDLWILGWLALMAFGLLQYAGLL